MIVDFIGHLMLSTQDDVTLEDTGLEYENFAIFFQKADFKEVQWDGYSTITIKSSEGLYNYLDELQKITKYFKENSINARGRILWFCGEAEEYGMVYIDDEYKLQTEFSSY